MAGASEVESHKNVKNVKELQKFLFSKIHFQCDSEGPRASKTPKNDQSDS